MERECETRHHKRTEKSGSIKMAIMKDFVGLQLHSVLKIWPFICILIVMFSVWYTWQSDTGISNEEMKLKSLINKTIATFSNLISSLYWISLPLSAGLAFVVVSWAAIYLDSRSPEIDPPFPLVHPVTKFPIQYATTLYLGVLITLKLVLENVQEEVNIMK